MEGKKIDTERGGRERERECVMVVEGLRVPEKMHLVAVPKSN